MPEKGKRRRLPHHLRPTYDQWVDILTGDDPWLGLFEKELIITASRTRHKVGQSAPYEDDTCWIWLWDLVRATSGQGYPRVLVYRDGEMTRESVNRLVFSIVHGRDPVGFLTTNCGNSDCIKPEHIVEKRPYATKKARNHKAFTTLQQKPVYSVSPGVSAQTVRKHPAVYKIGKDSPRRKGGGRSK